MRLRSTHLVLPLYVAATVALTWPLARTFAHAVPSTRLLNDTRAQAFLLGWDWLALRTDPLGVFDAPIFHPERNTLTYMDHLLGETLVAAPVLAVSSSVAAGYNFLVYLSFAVSAWAVYRLTRLLGVARPGAFLAGFLFAFSPYRFANLDQMNLLQTQFLPLALLFALRYLRRYRVRDLAGVAACLLAQVYFGWYYTFFLLLALSLLAAYALAQGSLAWRRLRPLPLLAAGAVFLALAAPVVLPYLERYGELPEYYRSLREVETYSASALDYLRVNRGALVGRWWPTDGADQAYWPGLVTVVLAAVGAGAVLGRRPRAAGERPAGRARRRLGAVRRALARWGEAGYFVVLAGAAVLLSFGPYVHAGGQRVAGPLPYAALYHLVPGFASMRAPGRLAVLALLALAVLAAMGYEVLWRRRRAGSPLTRAALVAALPAAVVLAWQRPLPAVELPARAALPPVYAWLAEQPGATPVLDLPVPASDVNESELDVLRQYYALHYRKPRLDGASGFVSWRYRKFRVVMRRFPDPASLDAAAALGARRLVVHFADYPRERRQALARRIAAEPRLRPLAAFGDDVVYDLLPGPLAGG